MRVVTMEEFLKLPQGTVFSWYREDAVPPFDEVLNVKTSDRLDAIRLHHADFVYYSLLGEVVGASNCDDLTHMYHAMEHGNAAAAKLESTITQRWGGYDWDTKLVVFDLDELKLLISELSMCLVALTTNQPLQRCAVAIDTQMQLPFDLDDSGMKVIESYPDSVKVVQVHHISADDM